MDQYNQTKLENGLKVVSILSPNIKMATIQLWIKAGSRYENEDQKGRAHVLEHLIFKGSKKFNSNLKISDSIDKYGGYLNAFTGKEGMYLITQIAEEHIKNSLDILSDMAINPMLDKNDLDVEKNVIVEEIESKQRDYIYRAYNLMMENIFQSHPLAGIILGSKDSVLSLNTEKIKEYHNQYFKPQNSMIIISSSFGHDKVVEFIKNSEFNKWIGGADDLLKSEDIDNENSEEKREKVIFEKENESKKTFIRIGYKTKGAKDITGMVALGLVKNFLAYGNSSFLHQKLRDKKGLVYGIGANNVVFSDSGVFTIGLDTTKKGELLDEIKNISEEILNNLTQEKILEKTKVQTVGAFIRLISDEINKVKFIGESFILGKDEIYPEDYIERVKKIGAEDIRRAVENYLGPKDSCTVIIGPEKI